MGKVFKWFFLLYNLLMIMWLAGDVSVTSAMSKTAVTSAEQAGMAIGAGIGISMTLGLWVVGAIIFGLPVLFTRPKH